MRKIKLLGLMALAAFALAATMAASASATTPMILVLPGEKVTEGKYTGTGGVSKLETAKGKSIVCTSVEAEANEFKEFEAGKTPEDGNLGIGHLHFLGCKEGKVACRSETKAGVKDNVEIILVFLDLHIADEKSTEGVLQPLLLSKVLGADKTESELLLNCGGVKEAVKGIAPCLILPGLTEVAAGGNVEILCKQKEGKQTTGECVETPTLCKELAEKPLLGNLGSGFESSGEEIHVKGSFNKMITIDD